MTHLVDVLCHLELMAPSARTDFLAMARRTGISDIVSAGTEPVFVGSRPHHALVNAVQGLPRVWRALGVHPSNAPRSRDELDGQLSALEQQLDHSAIIAIGECGLDRRPGFPPLSWQQEILAAQLRLARRHRLPVILHCVRAFGPLLAVLDEHKSDDLTGFVHGFTGAAELVPELVRRRMAISFGHRLCGPRAVRARAAANVVPEDALLIETDGPESSPEDFRRLLSILAELRGVAVEEISRLTSENARRVLQLSR